MVTELELPEIVPVVVPPSVPVPVPVFRLSVTGVALLTLTFFPQHPLS